MGRVPLSTLEEKAEESGDPEQYREDHKHEFQMANDILKGTKTTFASFHNNTFRELFIERKNMKTFFLFSIFFCNQILN